MISSVVLKDFWGFLSRGRLQQKVTDMFEHRVLTHLPALIVLLSLLTSQKVNFGFARSGRPHCTPFFGISLMMSYGISERQGE